MPINIISNRVKVKNNEGEYIGIDVLTDDTTANRLAAIQQKSTEVLENIQQKNTEAIASIQQKGTETLASIPNDYTTLANNVSNLNTAMETKAEVDGYYETLGAGTADQLNSKVYIEDNEPYVFRTSGGNIDIGDRVDEKLIGGTICWNQLGYSLNNTNEVYGITRVVTDNNKAVNIFGTATNSTNFTLVNMQSSVIANHKYLFMINNVNLPSGVYIHVGDPTVRRYAAIRNYSSENTTSSFGLYIPSGVAINVTVYPQIFDLTQMFGSTIADYIYNLDEATAGAGVAWFKKLFPKLYYEYNPGELISVAAARKEAVGFNAWDEEEEKGAYTIYGASGTGSKLSTNDYYRTKNFIPVIPSTTYHIHRPSAGNQLYIGFYDASQNWLGYNEQGVLYTSTYGTAQDFNFTTSALAHYIVFYDNHSLKGTCVNLSWSGYRDGEYESYKKSTTDFDSELELRGILKLDANNNLYYDGDTYESDGTVTRKFAEVTLTADMVEKDTNVYDNATYAIIRNLHLPDMLVSATKQGIISKYGHAKNVWPFGGSNTIGMLIPNFSTYVFVVGYPIGTTLDQMKADLAGMKILYELATPTTETATPFTKSQWVNDFGTEQFIDAKVLAGSRDVSMPVGHESKYLANLRDKLQHLPEPAEENGDYYIRQKNEQMELVNFGDGYNHPKGVVGTAQQLESTIYDEDKVPYAFRTSGGSADIGNRVDEEIVGGTICWNQLLQNGNFAENSYWRLYTSTNGTFSIANNIATITYNASSTGGYNYGLIYTGYTDFHIQTDHIYFLNAEVKTDFVSSAQFELGTSLVQKQVLTPNIWNHIGIIDKRPSYSSADTIIIKPVDSSITSGNNFQVRNFMLVDLTQMFGATIANYVYTLERATAGAGVAWFKSLFPKDYYAYNPGELMSVNAARKETVGFNQWDKEIESGAIDTNTGVNISNTQNYRSKNYIPVISNMVYCYSNKVQQAGIRIIFYNHNKEYIGTIVNGNTTPQTFTIPSNAAYLRFYWGYIEGVCINLSWSGSRNGEYEPYKKLSHNLGDVELRGIPKLDANNKLYYDGDTYSNDGTVTRKYGIVDLGTLTWNASNYRFNTNTTLPNAKRGNHADCLCPMYKSDVGAATRTSDMSVCLANHGYVYIYDTSFTGDDVAFKTAMSGVYLVYELATPTEETSTPYLNPSHVDDWGTEEFIDRAVEAGDRDVSFPVGHNSKYMANLRDKLQHLPDLAANNGTYIINQSNNAMALISIGNIIDNTLSEAGKAADAKKTGDELVDLKTANNNTDVVNNIILNKKYTYNGNTAVQWVQNVLPTSVTNGSIALTGISGVEDGTMPYVLLNVIYTDSTEGTMATITELNRLYRFQTRTDKTISRYVFKLCRSNAAPSGNVTSSWNIVCIDGKTNDEKISDAVAREDEKQAFSDATTGTKYITDKTFTDTGTAVGVWKQPGIPADIETPYICVTNVSGLSDPTHLMYVFVLYTDNTSQNIYIDNLNEWVKLNINKNKTVQSYSLYCYRADSTVESSTASSWTVAISDGNLLTETINGIKKQNEYLHGQIDSSYKALANKVYDNHSSGDFYGVEDVDYTAVTASENWQTKSYTKEIIVPIGANELLSFGCVARDGLGLQFGSVTLKRSGGSADVVYPANTSNTKRNNHGGFVYTCLTPSNTTEARIQFQAISNASTAGEASEIGHTYYVHGGFAFKGQFLQNGASAMAAAWENAIETIKTEQEAKFVIGIQTDTHYYNGCSNVIGYNLNQLSRAVSMDCIANLGDLIQGYADDAENDMRESMTTIVERYCNGAECPMLFLLGNHDSNAMYAAAHSGEEFTFGELYGRMIKPTINKTPNIQIGNGNMYYYVDFPALRLIALNTNDGDTPHDYAISQAQQTWFENEALNTEKPVLVLSHVPLVSGITDNYDASFAGIITALNTFKNDGGDVVACFFGHVHTQTSALSTGNILQVGFTWSGGYAGQDTAEIVTIDTVNKTIKTYGFGNATSRTFNY